MTGASSPAAVRSHRGVLWREERGYRQVAAHQRGQALRVAWRSDRPSRHTRAAAAAAAEAATHDQRRALRQQLEALEVDLVGLRCAEPGRAAAAGRRARGSRGAGASRCGSADCARALLAAMPSSARSCPSPTLHQNTSRRGDSIVRVNSTAKSSGREAVEPMRTSVSRCPSMFPCATHLRSEIVHQTLWARNNVTSRLYCGHQAPLRTSSRTVSRQRCSKGNRSAGPHINSHCPSPSR